MGINLISMDHSIKQKVDFLTAMQGDYIIWYMIFVVLTYEYIYTLHFMVYDIHCSHINIHASSNLCLELPAFV